MLHFGLPDIAENGRSFSFSQDLSSELRFTKVAPPCLFFLTVNGLSAPIGGLPLLWRDEQLDDWRLPPKVSLDDELPVMVWLRLIILSGEGLETSNWRSSTSDELFWMDAISVLYCLLD